MENLVVTTIRLEQTFLNEIDSLAEKENLDRTSILRKALAEGIKEIKLRYALERYQQGKISVGKIKEIAGISLWEVLDIIKARGIGFRTDEEHLMEQIKQLKK